MEVAFRKKGIKIVDFDIKHLLQELIINSFPCFNKNKKLTYLLKDKIDIKEKLIKIRN